MKFIMNVKTNDIILEYKKLNGLIMWINLTYSISTVETTMFVKKKPATNPINTPKKVNIQFS